MRYFEIAGGIRMAVSLEEQSLLDLAGKEMIADANLEERDQEIARNMVSRGLFNRLNRDGKLYYSLNGLEDVWRI
jgi:hypothetical protein